MAISLNNITTANDYADAATLGPIANAQQITVVVANAAVYMQISTGSYGQQNWSSELLVTPSSFTLTQAGGVRFRSAVTSTPAQVVATAWLPGDAQPVGSTPFTQTLSASGSISTPGGSTVIAYAQKTSNTSITATTEATADTIVTAAAATFDGATACLFTYFCPYISYGAANQYITFVLYDGATAVGQLGLIGPQGVAAADLAASLSYRFTPAAGAHTYSIRAFVNLGTSTVRGGTAAAGQVIPTWLRIASDT